MSGQAVDLGSGALSRGASLVHWHLVVDLLMVLVCAPGLVVAVLLAPVPSNTALLVLTALPVGPALAAALYAFEVGATDRDLAPARHFVRGLRLNTLDVLRLWVPGLAVLALIATNVALSSGAGLTRGLVGVSIAVAVVVILWLANVLVIAARFSFRSRDVARLGIYYLFRRPAVPLTVVSLLVVAVALVVTVGEWSLLLTASLFPAWLHRHSAGLRADIEERFTR